MRIALTIVVAAVALSLVPAAPAAQPDRASSGAVSRQGYELTIATVPPMAGVRFTAGGQTFASGRDGIASIVLPAGTYGLELVDRDFQRGGVRSRFARWESSAFTPDRVLNLRGPTHLQVGFERSVLVDLAFVDRSEQPVDKSLVTKVTLTSTIGTRDSFKPDRPRWLIASRIARRFDGIEATQIEYALQRAVYAGTNVVHKAQQRFYPSKTRRVVLHLLLYSVRLRAHDLLFGFGMGKSADLTYPDGRRISFPLAGGKRLSSLPRGTYAIKVHAWGYTPLVTVALSKDQSIDLRVVSYLDMIVMFLGAAAISAFLILARRPRTRARLAQNWRRWTKRGGAVPPEQPGSPGPPPTAPAAGVGAPTPELEAWKRSLHPGEEKSAVTAPAAVGGSVASADQTRREERPARTMPSPKPIAVNGRPKEIPVSTPLSNAVVGGSVGIPEKAAEQSRRLTSKSVDSPYRWSHPPVSETRDRDGGTQISPDEPRTHCQKGHEFTVENTYTRPGTRRRECRTCRRERARLRRRGRRDDIAALEPVK
jgi:hypothetical protein